MSVEVTYAPALLLVAFGALIVAGARPTAVLTLPMQQKIIILAMDVSGSMRATDVTPDRITAYQAAAKTFAKELPPSVRIGVVAAIDRFQLQRGTAIGSGIVVALATIFPDAGIDLSKITGQRNMPRALATPRRSCRTAGVFAGAAGLAFIGGHYAAHRWPANGRSRFRWTPPRWPPIVA